MHGLSGPRESNGEGGNENYDSMGPAMRKSVMILALFVPGLTVAPDTHAACIPTYYDDCGSGSGASSYGASPDSAYQERMRQEREDRQQRQIEKLERENRILREREEQRRRARRETFGSPREPSGAPREPWGN